MQLLLYSHCTRPLDVVERHPVESIRVRSNKLKEEGMTMCKVPKNPNRSPCPSADDESRWTVTDRSVNVN